MSQVSPVEAATGQRRRRIAVAMSLDADGVEQPAIAEISATRAGAQK